MTSGLPHNVKADWISRLVEFQHRTRNRGPVPIVRVWLFFYLESLFAKDSLAQWSDLRAARKDFNL